MNEHQDRDDLERRLRSLLSDQADRVPQRLTVAEVMAERATRGSRSAPLLAVAAVLAVAVAVFLFSRPGDGPTPPANQLPTSEPAVTSATVPAVPVETAGPASSSVDTSESPTALTTRPPTEAPSVPMVPGGATDAPPAPTSQDPSAPPATPARPTSLAPSILDPTTLAPATLDPTSAGPTGPRTTGPSAPRTVEPGTTPASVEPDPGVPTTAQERVLGTTGAVRVPILTSTTS